MPTVEELRRQAEKKMQQKTAQPSGESLLGQVGKYYGDASRAMAQGLLFGGGDEAIAYGRSLLGGGDYEGLLKEERQRLEEMSPWVRYPGEVSGALGTALVNAPISAGARAAQLAAKIPGWAKAMGIGALWGGGYGFGSGEGGVESRLESAGTGAAVGGVTAGLLNPIVRGAQAGASAAAQAVRKRAHPESAAAATLRKAFQRDEITRSQAATALREQGPQAMVADVGGRNVRGVAREVTTTPGQGQNRAERILMQRAESEGKRLGRAVDTGIKMKDYYAAEESFLRNMKEKAAPLYQEAYQKNQSIMTPRLNKIIRGSVGRNAMREAAALFEIERSAGTAKYLGAVDKELTEALRAARDVGKTPGIGPIQPGVIKGFSLETWDQIKRGLDSLLDKPAYRNELTGRLNAKGSAVYQLKKTLLKELDEATGGDKGAYARARGIYAGDAEALEALREGRKFLGKDPEVISRDLSKLSEAGREAYRTGAARKLKDLVGSVPDDASAANRIFSRTLNRDRLKAIYGEDYQKVAKVLAFERKAGKDLNYYLRGSQTKDKLTQEADILSQAAGFGALSAGSHAGLFLAAARRRLGQALGKADKDPYFNELSKMLFSRNRAQNMRALDEIFDDVGLLGLSAQTKQRLADMLLPRALGQASGRAAGELSYQSGQ